MIKAGEKIICKKSMLWTSDVTNKHYSVFTKDKIYTIDEIDSKKQICICDDENMIMVFDTKETILDKVDKVDKELNDRYIFYEYFYTISELRIKKIKQIEKNSDE